MTGPPHDPLASEHSRGLTGTKSLRADASVAGMSLVALVFVLLAAWTWRKWPDLIVDFGTQLYIPWRLNQGAVLYRDLFYFAGGPVSQYFNALLFKIFGTSFSTLIAANLVLVVIFLGYVYRRFLAITDALTATMVCLAIVVIFTFSEYTPVGNYNYIAPYSHESVHGALLSLLVVGLLSDWLIQQRLRAAGLAGFCAGIVFLTKPEIFVALCMCAAAALALHWWRRREIRFALKSTGCFGLMFLLPSLFFFVFFLRVEDWRTSLQSVVFGWTPLFQSEVRNNPFYRTFTGMDQPARHLKEMATHYMCAMAAIGVYAVLFRTLERWKMGPLRSPWIPWLILVLPLLWWAGMFRWTVSGDSLPLWCLTILIVLAWRLKSEALADDLAFPFLWSVFALVLMSKLGLLPRIWHYGFVLAMPAFVITVYFLLWLLPKMLEHRFQVPAQYMRGAFALTLLAGFAVLLSMTNQFYRIKGQSVGRGGDRIVTYMGTDYTDGIGTALGWMDKNLPADATLAVLPSGVTLNYLSRHVNSTPDLFWDPNSMAVFGQQNMTARFEATPPDYVLLIEQDHSEFGVGYFGSYPGYGVDLMQWIKKNYKVELIIGHEPLRDGRFGLEFLKRVSPQERPPASR